MLALGWTPRRSVTITDNLDIVHVTDVGDDVAAAVHVDSGCVRPREYEIGTRRVRLNGKPRRFEHQHTRCVREDGRRADCSSSAIYQQYVALTDAGVRRDRDARYARC
jgi:hypothetical protein